MSTLRHCGHGFAPIAPGVERGKINTRGTRDFLAGHIGSQSRSLQGADVDHQDLMSALANHVRDKGVFLPFCIHRAEYCDRGHKEWEENIHSVGSRAMNKGK